MWSLWATNGGTGAQITSGWVLNLFVAPTITSTVTNISIPEETSTNISFTVASIDSTITNASDVTVTSANTDLITVHNLTFDLATGKGAAQLTAIFKDTGPQHGSTTVTVTAKDNNNFTVSFTYNVTVTFVNHSPVISFISRQVTRAGTPLGPVSFTVSDPDLPAQGLTVTGSSDRQSLLPDSNILIQGSGANRTFTLFRSGDCGFCQRDLCVSDVPPYRRHILNGKSQGIRSLLAKSRFHFRPTGAQCRIRRRSG